MVLPGSYSALMWRKSSLECAKLLPGISLGLALSMLPAFGDEVVVFAASSLKGPLDRVAADFQKATGHEVLISYGGSNALAAQILQGAPADIFLSAAPNWMDEVEKAGLLAAGQRADLWGNELVLVAHGAEGTPVTLGPDLNIVALLGGGKLSMGDVNAVPAGQYGKAALEHFGLWQAASPHVIQSPNVRAALAFVALGEAPFGIVYASDAQSEPAVSVVAEFPASSHPPIRYPGAALSGAGPADLAFFQALSAAPADEIFSAAGFTVLN